MCVQLEALRCADISSAQATSQAKLQSTSLCQQLASSLAENGAMIMIWQKRGEGGRGLVVEYVEEQLQGERARGQTARV